MACGGSSWRRASTTASGTKTGGAGRNTTRSFRRSFPTSYASRIGERLSTASEQATREVVASETAPALLAAHSDAVRDAAAEQFPDLTRVTTAANNREGWAAGRDEIPPQ
ncbi:hypothetical protein [Actinoplanes sp. G11-F43]|uniref:hypothetical protein n=1 Tax=Actinoplanes sp. G11-F43 TaxID=3424130 RepID=UPI003D32E358